LTLDVMRQGGARHYQASLRRSGLGQRYGAFEARRARSNTSSRRDRPKASRTGIDIDMNRVPLPSESAEETRNGLRVPTAEIAVAPDRACQRAHIAGKGDVVQFERARLPASCSAIRPVD